MRRSKYGAKPTVVDGVRFASKKEAARYVELKMLEKAGEIKELELQPRFLLHTWTNRVGEIVKALGEYRGDFRYRDKQQAWNFVVEDVKGFKTPLYRWKKKHVEAQYGIDIREV